MTRWVSFQFFVIFPFCRRITSYLHSKDDNLKKLILLQRTHKPGEKANSNGEKQETRMKSRETK